MAGVRAGDDRRVVRERDRRQRRERAVPERDAHLDQAGDVRRFAARGHVVEDVRVRAVEQEPDDVARPLARVEEIGEGVPVLAGEELPPFPLRFAPGGAQPSRAQMVGATSTRRAEIGDEAELADTLAAEHERRACLHEPERAVLTEVAALVFPVVRGRMQHAEVGARRAHRRAGRSGRTRAG